MQYTTTESRLEILEINGPNPPVRSIPSRDRFFPSQKVHPISVQTIRKNSKTYLKPTPKTMKNEGFTPQNMGYTP